jgi:hypothetical protein
LKKLNCCIGFSILIGMVAGAAIAIKPNQAAMWMIEQQYSMNSTSRRADRPSQENWQWISCEV